MSLPRMRAFMGATLALSLIGLSGCFKPDVSPEWTVKGGADNDYVRRVYQDRSGCYWLDDDGTVRALLVIKDAPNKQWCDAPPSERTEISVAPSSAKTGSTR